MELNTICVKFHGHLHRDHLLCFLGCENTFTGGAGVTSAKPKFQAPEISEVNSAYDIDHRAITFAAQIIVRFLPLT